MQSFLKHPELLGEDSNPNPALLHALTLCHERFLHVVAAELVVSHRRSTEDASGDASGEGIRRIGAGSVEVAMRELGMEDLLQQAQQSLQSSSKKISKAQTKKKRRQFTDEQIAEQERLLESSKNKVVKH